MLRRCFQDRAAGSRDLGAGCWITVRISVFSKLETRVKYLDHVPFGNVALDMTAIGDSTVMSEAEVGV